MSTYKVRFVARKNGALGIRYEITHIVQALDAAGAVLALYDLYEHIEVLEIQELPEDPSGQACPSCGMVQDCRQDCEDPR